jgi:hypothetical protein
MANQGGGRGGRRGGDQRHPYGHQGAEGGGRSGSLVRPPQPITPRYVTAAHYLDVTDYPASTLPPQVTNGAPAAVYRAPTSQQGEEVKLAQGLMRVAEPSPEAAKAFVSETSLAVPAAAASVVVPVALTKKGLVVLPGLAGTLCKRPFYQLDVAHKTPFSDDTNVS